MGEEEEDLEQNQRKIKAWERNATQGRRTQELRGNGRLERGLLTPPARKRLGEGEDGADTLDSSLESSTTRKNKKKFKYPLLTNWGEEGTPPTPPSNPPLRPADSLRNLAEETPPPSTDQSRKLEDDLNQGKDDLVSGNRVVEATDSSRSMGINNQE